MGLGEFIKAHFYSQDNMHTTYSCTTLFWQGVPRLIELVRLEKPHTAAYQSIGQLHTPDHDQQTPQPPSPNWTWPTPPFTAVPASLLADCSKTLFFLILPCQWTFEETSPASLIPSAAIWPYQDIRDEVSFMIHQIANLISTSVSMIQLFDYFVSLSFYFKYLCIYNYFLLLFFKCDRAHLKFLHKVSDFAGSALSYNS
jgi:hypothetical protein